MIIDDMVKNLKKRANSFLDVIVDVDMGKYCHGLETRSDAQNGGNEKSSRGFFFWGNLLTESWIICFHANDSLPMVS